jgi:hypothetical protein
MQSTEQADSHDGMWQGPHSQWQALTQCSIRQRSRWWATHLIVIIVKAVPPSPVAVVVVVHPVALPSDVATAVPVMVAPVVVAHTAIVVATPPATPVGSRCTHTTESSSTSVAGLGSQFGGCRQICLYV